jgi:chromosome segregation ATPase
MSQFVSNSAQRRNSMIRFTALFLLAVVLGCFAFLRLFYVQTEIPKQELQQFKELAPVMKSLVDYGESLQQYELAITTNSVEAPKLESVANKHSVDIHSMLMGKEKNPHYPYMSKILDMGDRFYASLKEVEKKFLPVQKELIECKRDIEDFEDEKTEWKEEKDELKRKIEELEAKIARCRRW